jgi:hypothetical protein
MPIYPVFNGEVPIHPVLNREVRKALSAQIIFFLN